MIGRSQERSQERYRFLISDGVSAQHAMLAVQLNDRVKSAQVEKGSIVQLIDYICSNVKGRKSRLSYEQFSAFLANIKELNARKQSREETLRKAEDIFGKENNDLYISFKGLLTSGR